MGERPSLPGRLDGGSSRNPGRGGTAAGPRGGPAAVRSEARTAPPGSLAQVVARGAFDALYASPHRRGRMVDGDPDPRGHGALHRLRLRAPNAAAATAATTDPVCRLCGLAAGAPDRRGAGSSPRTVAGAAGRCTHGARPADRPAASTRPELARRDLFVAPPDGAGGPARRAGIGGGRHAVHGPACRLRGIPLSTDRQECVPDRLDDRQSRPAGDREPHRFFCQLSGAPCRASPRG